MTYLVSLISLFYLSLSLFPCLLFKKLIILIFTRKGKKKSYRFLTLSSIYRNDILVPIFRKVRYRSMKNDWSLVQNEVERGMVDWTSFYNKGF